MAPRRKSYTLQFKKATIIELDANRGNVKKTAKTFKISRTCVVRWRDARDDIFKANDPNSDTGEHEHEHKGGSDAANSRIRLMDRQHKRRLRKRKALYPLMEDELFNYITELRSRGIIVHRNAGKKKAKELMPQYYPHAVDFSGSDGWCTRFFKRKGLSHRAVTSVGQKVPNDAADKAKKYLNTLRALLK